MSTQTMPRPTGTCSYNCCKCFIILCWRRPFLPLWTRDNLWLSFLKNYRPVPSLSFIQNLTEREIEYKVLLLIYKALHCTALYICKSLPVVVSVYSKQALQSETNNLPRVPRCRLEGFGRRCFAYAAPSIWKHLLHLVTVPRLLIPSRVAWKVIYIM